MRVELHPPLVYLMHLKKLFVVFDDEKERQRSLTYFVSGDFFSELTAIDTVAL